MFKTILLAYDGSEHGKKAAHLARGLKEVHGARLFVVHAYEPVPDYLGEPLYQALLAQRLERAEEVLREGLALVGEAEGEVLEGEAAEAILRAAEAHGADLIVMGTRGLGGLKGVFLGSQSQKVVAHAPCPVLLAR
jgi:nucleotide-binding universal stress UspA family protein